VLFASRSEAVGAYSPTVMRPLVLEEAPIAEAEAHTVTAAATSFASGAGGASFAVPLEEIPEPALNALVTVPQAARFLQMPEGLVVDLTKWGTIPCLRSGEERYIRFADVVAHRRVCEESERLDRDDPLDAVRDQIIAGGFDELP